MLISINEEDFKEKIKIKFSNITEGFNRFKSLTLEDYDNKDTEEKMINFTMEAFEINGEENSYVDFYYNLLSEEDKKRLNELVSDEDKIFLKEFKKESSDKGVYYKLTKESIPFITRLNIRENLFCTIYFTKEPCTIWGNYNKRFPLFYEDDKSLEKYRLIAKKYGLIIR